MKLIKNYNEQTHKYELGKQGIDNFTINEIKDLLKEFPIEPPISDFPAMILTSESCIKRVSPDPPDSNKDCCKINYLATKKRFLIKSSRTKEIEELKEEYLLRKEWDELNLKKKIKLILQISTIFYYTSIVFYAIIFVFLKYLYALNVSFLILWCWVVLLSIYDLIACGAELWNDISRRDHVIYTIPIVDEFKGYYLLRPLVRITISYGILTFLVSGLLVEELGIQFGKVDSYILYILLIILTSYVLVLSSSIFYTYFKKKNKKVSMIRNLNKFIQEKSDDWNEKQFLIRIIIELKNKRVINIGFFSKFVTILTFFLTSIPTITGLYF